MNLSHQNRRPRGGDCCDGAGRMGVECGARTGVATSALPRIFPRHYADPGQSADLSGEKGSIVETCQKGTFMHSPESGPSHQKVTGQVGSRACPGVRAVSTSRGAGRACARCGGRSVFG